jgi:dipeptidyl aminopeptidase/acylaminoacyl peptidase
MQRTVMILACLFVLISSFAALAQEVERKEMGNLVIEGIPEIPQRIIDRMLQYQNTRSTSLSGWDSEGEGIFISTRFGETSQIHYVAVPGGARKQITFFNEPVRGAAICPDRSRDGFLFAKDVGGGEFYQIFYYDLKTGSFKMLTDGSSRNGGVEWSNKGDRFVYYSTKRNGRDWDIYVSSITEPEKAVSVVEDGGFWYPGEWSPDDTKLVVGRYVSANESYGYIVDLETKKLEQLNPSEKKIAYRGIEWSKDGKGIFYSSDEDTEFQHLRYYDCESKTSKILTGDIPWDVENFDISHNSDFLAFRTNENGMSRLYIMETNSFKYRRIEDIPVGQIYGLRFNPDGKRLAFVINTPQTPGDTYVLNIDGDKLERWTFSEVGGLDTDSFVVPTVIHYETFDEVDGKQRMIPSFYYRPKGKGPFPVLINIHGGPEGQYTPNFSSTMQYAVNELGIAVLGPNVRGSAGYGKSYLKLDNGYKREDSVKDIGSLLEWIQKQPELDASRVVVLGGSYGGYMVLAAMTHYNDRLMAGIDIVGISNFVTFLENTKEYRRDLRRVEYGDERDPGMREFLERISPTTNASRITKPMFIIQGLNDPRVPVTESEQMVAEIRKNGGDVWYLLAKDEGHGFRKKKNRDYMSYSLVLFLEEHLLK